LSAPITGQPADSQTPLLPQNPYDAVFWLTYTANTALMVAVSSLFRYSDFVKFLGGNEFQLGLIVGLGTTGSLLMRVVQGVGIDRFGPRMVWLLSLVGFIVSMGVHLLIADVHSPIIFAARILMMSSLAGAFGASLTFVSLRVPEQRIAEMIGSLGSSGFVGLALGPTMADMVMPQENIELHHLQRMFVSAAVATTVSLFFATLATRGEIRQRQLHRPALWRVVWQYHPGVLLLVAAAMGLGVSLPGVFLQAFARDTGVGAIRQYFIIYAVVAFSVRIATRRLTERIGVRPMIYIGAGFLSVSMLCYMVVHNQWMWWAPAIPAGIAHAFLFPAVMGGGGRAFPVVYRGLATTLMLALFDLGNLFGQPFTGAVIELARQAHLPAYPVMFCTIAALMVSVVAVYAAEGIYRRPKQQAAEPSLKNPP